MSTSKTLLEKHQRIAPLNVTNTPLTLLPIREKAFVQAPQVIALFKEIQAGRHIDRDPWTCFQLVRGEYDEIERRIRQDDDLFGFVKDKIRCVGRRNGNCVS